MKRKVRPGPGSTRVSLKQLANHLGLSQSAVSFVLNNAPQAKTLSEETRRRILAAAAQLNYKPSYFARMLGRTRTNSIGVIVPELSEGYFTLVMGGIEQYLLKTEYLYFIFCHYWQPALLAEYPQLLADRGAEGLLLLNTNVDFETSLPVVAISGHRTRPGVTNIVLDHELSARLAIEHLAQLGHRHIAFMKGQPFSMDSDFRWNAIVDAARDHGIPVCPELTIHLDSNSWSPELGYEPVKRLLAKTQAFTALFCFNDTAAIGAIRALIEAGLRIPQDVSVLGFDDIMTAAYLNPSLTTVRQPLLEMGQKGAALLLEKIEYPKKDFPSEILFEPELVVRNSTQHANPARLKSTDKPAARSRRSPRSAVSV